MLICNDGSWLVAYTIYRNNGYLIDSSGGNEIQISRSVNKGKTWSVISIITDPGRDLDNAQFLQLASGDILLACRSVIWYQSYHLHVYRSQDGGINWSYLSTIDAIDGASGELTNPDRGVYEPYMLQIDSQRIGVMYASEKYAASTPCYSQVIAMKISTDNGLTWGNEILTVYDTIHSNARPGMPVWSKMNNNKYIMVYEIVGTTDVEVFYKITENVTDWPEGMGTWIPNQKGAPYVLSLENGVLLVTSNSHNISVSEDYAVSWSTLSKSPYGSLFDVDDNLWPALYEIDTDIILFVTSFGRAAAGYFNSGHNIQYKIGYINISSNAVLNRAHVKIRSKHSGKYLDVSAGSMQENANVQIWDENYALPEEWQFISIDNNYYKILSSNSGKALTVIGNTAGSNVVQASWINSETQKWRIAAAGNGFYNIISKTNNLYLDVDAGRIEAGSNVQVWTANGLDPEKWQLEIVSGIRENIPYIIMAKHSNKVLDVENGLSMAGANVQQWESNGNSWQQWILSGDIDSFYSVINVNSQLALDVDSGSIINGANVQQWTLNGLNPQKWTIINTKRGFFTFLARHSGKSLDVDAGITLNGANVQQWEYNGLDPQLWRIILV
jgi:hypothetical protein